MKRYLIVWLSILTVLLCVTACSKKTNEDKSTQNRLNKEENTDREESNSEKTKETQKLMIYSLWDNVTVRQVMALILF